MKSSDHNLTFLADMVRWLGEQLGQVIVALEGQRTLDLVEELRHLAKSCRSGDAAARNELRAAVARLTPADAYDMAMAFTTYFELVNLAEEDYRARLLRHRRAQPDAPEPVRESIDAALLELKRRGRDSADLQRLMDEMSIELVFTAHPTESKRRTVLTKLQRIKWLLWRDPRPPSAGAPAYDAETTLSIRQEIAALWLTDRSRTQQPLVTDEVKTGLWYFDATLWSVVPQLQTDLESALAKHYPGARAPRRWLTFGSWMGGDRDGNPNVTTAVTAETIHLHRRGALEKFRGAARDLARRMSISRRRDNISPAVDAIVDGSDAFMSTHVRELAARYPNEPYRVALSALASRLDDAQQATRVQPLFPLGFARTLALSPTLQLPLAPQPAVSEADVARVLDTLIASLRAGQGRILVDGDLANLRVQLNTFGLNMARLDIRQHSDRHESAVAEIFGALRGLGEDAPDNYARYYESAKVALLNDALNAPAASVIDRVGGLSDETLQVIEPFMLAREAEKRYGEGVFGLYVISMTRELSDALEPLLLMRWARASLPIAPLFETLDDLRRAPHVLRMLFEHPGYRQHLAAFGNHQTIMLGYSDSNKDCGYLTSSWALFEAQETIARACAEAGVTFTLFHGRGGSIARGGGPAARAILAQPAGLKYGRIRVTEQGEVLSTRYHDADIAHRHLEQMAYGVLLAADEAQRPRFEPPAAWREMMTVLSARGYAAYKALVHDNPEFIVFWRQATPIDEIGLLKLGSRPAFRKPSNSVADLRAIPWVFSWMQSRFGFPGWFGLGAALQAALALGSDALATLSEMYRGWMFFATLIDNAQQSLTKSDLSIAEQYLGLVTDAGVRERVWAILQNEHAAARAAILAITGQSELLDNEPMLQRSIHLRNPYVDPLNYIQAEMIQRLRADSASPALSAEEIRTLREVIELTINGVSSGLKNTG